MVYRVACHHYLATSPMTDVPATCVVSDHHSFDPEVVFVVQWAAVWVAVVC
jgi:hypothetical protein